MNYTKQERWTSPEIERLLALRFRDAEIADFFSRPKTRRNRQVAWVQISERLQRELPLSSGDARSVAQCEQKLKNLRKEYLRVRFHQGRLQRGEVVGSLRLPDYWPLLEATLGTHVEAKRRHKETQQSPSSGDGERRRSVEARFIGGEAVQRTPPTSNGKRRRDEAPAPASEAPATTNSEDRGSRDTSAHTGGDGQEEDALESSPTKRSRQSKQILESVERLNRLVGEFMGPGADVDASQPSTERRLAALEDDVRQLRASMSTISANMNLLLARLADPRK